MTYQPGDSNARAVRRLDPEPEIHPLAPPAPAPPPAPALGGEVAIPIPPPDTEPPLFSA